MVHTPVGVNQIVIKKAIRAMIEEATRRGKLRPNSVDSVTGRNSGLNLGPGTPVIHFEQWEEDEIEVRLILKGGGCENKNIQYSLPDDSLDHVGKAGRDIDGVYKMYTARDLAGAGAGLQRRAFWGCASEATGRAATTSPRSSFSATLRIPTPIRRWPSWRRA